MFRRIFLAALLGGLVAGCIATAVQALRAVPLILEAEVFEQASEPVKPDTGKSHDHFHGVAPHAHDGEERTPADGWERTFYTLVFNILAAVGFGLLLSAGMALTGLSGWMPGLGWGVAGYATFVLAPAIGLPPEVPGTEAAPLLLRQVWWVGTAAATGAGLALIFLRGGAIAIVAGLALLALPHLIGAPQPAVHGGSAPDSLAREFIFVALATGLVFWLVLGAFAGVFYRRFSAA
jgi:cobalt transporter subunit CbtA